VYAVITVEHIDKKEAGYIHFKCKAQKAWNCNVQEIIADLSEGERYKIDYAETAPSGGRKYGSKYVNRARLWQPDDGPNTWPDKEPYNPNGNTSSSGGNGGGKSMAKSDFDPEVSKRQTCINAAGNVIANAYSGLGMNLDQFAIEFPAVFDIMYKKLSESTFQPVGAGSDTSPASTDNIPF